MLIDESKMAVDSSFSFLNLRKQHTILNGNFYLRLKHKTTLTEQNRSTNTSYDRPGSDCKRLNRDRPDSGRTLHTLAIAQFRSPNSDRQTIRLHKPTTDTHTQQKCPRN